MRFPWLAQPKIWRILSPDFVEEREGRALLIWADHPYGLVAERALPAQLSALDGRTLEEALQERPEWAAQRKRLQQQLKTLEAAGIAHQHDGQVDEEPALVEPMISQVAVNLTRRCNLRCSFCYALSSLVKHADDELAPQEIIDFLRMIAPMVGQQPTLTISGGEPLLEPEKTLEVGIAALKEGYTPIIATNGTLITEAFARQARGRLQVQVSLDGHAASLHDPVRGSGVFRDAVEGVKRLVAQRVHTILNLVVHRGNLHLLDEYLVFARSLGVNQVRLTPLKRLGGAASPNCPWQAASHQELLQQIGEMLDRHPEYLRLLGPDIFTLLAQTCRSSAKRLSCGSGRETVLLDADGTLYPCPSLSQQEFRIANIRQPALHFDLVWRESPVLKRVRHFTAAGLGGHAVCPVRQWCLGGCRGENYQLTGGLDKRPAHCAERRRAVLDMLWRIADHPEQVAAPTRYCG
jgi:radical SAM protein with 4Fe4S-binding SPASM domain